jgi:hypothetical protein
MGLGVLVVGILTLLLIPALQAPIRNNVTDPAMQTVVGQVLSVFTWGLAIQSLIVGLIGVLLIVVSRFVSSVGAQAYASPTVPDEQSVRVPRVPEDASDPDGGGGRRYWGMPPVYGRELVNHPSDGWLPAPAGIAVPDEMETHVGTLGYPWIP